ncbi:MAG: bifunctional metallophosphatase/5'-nucleotidase, partial [Planctomycetaceae bacterium]|nr:bifunctional metallophosphatase/5'-nucleotidase [Planctomycetaceae bacterium]
MTNDASSRREFLVGSATGAAALLLSSQTAFGSEGKKTFTILHTNDLHSNFLGMSPASDYSPFDLDNDRTRGGFARLAALISKRKDARKQLGPVLILDGGDYSMGTAFGAATRETGAELRLMSRMGYDATTLGNHDFDLGPDGLAESVETAVKSGPIPTVVASNTDISAEDPKLTGLRKLTGDGAIRRHLVIERGEIRFGIFGLLGKGAAFYTVGAGAVKFSDAIETAKEAVKQLREQEKVDVVICLSHGGVEKGADGRFTAGEDVQLAQAVPGIDVVIGGHTHTELKEPILVNGRTPVVQTGKYGDNLGELVITLDGNKLQVESYKLHPIDDSIAGDKTIADEIEKVKNIVTDSVFASRGYRIDQPLAVVPRDLPNTFTDIAAGTLLANLVTDSFRKATKADIGFTANGLMRSSLTRGQSGVQTVYDVFAVAPLGDGIVDTTAGSALVTAYFTGAELKAILEFCLLDNPSHPGEYFPRVSGLRYFYDKSRSPFDVVTAVEIGDLDRGYTPIDVTGQDKRLYSLACPLYLGLFIVAIPKYTKGKLTLVPKNKDGVPLKSRTEALEMPQGGSPDLLPPKGDVDGSSVAVATAELSGVREIKEWQAIMDYLRDLPA